MSREFASVQVALGSGRTISLLDALDSWAGCVRRFHRELDLPTDAPDAFGADDYVGALFGRDRIAKALDRIGAGRKRLRRSTISFERSPSRTSGTCFVLPQSPAIPGGGIAFRDKVPSSRTCAPGRRSDSTSPSGNSLRLARRDTSPLTSGAPRTIAFRLWR
jgi:hypothetical protein